MASINFLLQSTSNPANIYVRIIDGRKIDIKTKTNFVINPSDWSDAKQRPKNLKNTAFKNLDVDLQNLKTNLLNHYNNSKGDTISLSWLKNFINPVPVNNIPTDLVSYFDFYLKDRGSDISHRSELKFRVVQNKLKEFQKHNKRVYFLKDVNVNFKNEFEKYCRDNGYAENTILSNIKEIKCLCFHARRKGLPISPELEEIKITQKKASNIYLTFEELEKIENTEFKDDNLKDARDWLLISCYTAQRVSDFMRFVPEMIRTENNVKLIEFTQKKTGKLMTLPLHKKVIEILNKRNFQFPKRIADQKYNGFIKTVCKSAGINNIVAGGKMENHRKKEGRFPKYQLVTSHIGRRSFATNFYGKIPTSLLISATGHSTEQMFLAYIGKSNTDKAIQLSEYF